MVDKPTEEDRLGFVRSYGVEPVDVNTDLTFKDAATAVAEMTPIIGDAMAAKEIYDELMKDDPNYGLIAALGGAALIGAIPGIGDAAAAGIRKAADTIKRIEVDPDALGSLGGNIRLKPKKESGRGLVRDVDDLVDTAGTACKACEVLTENGATDVYMLACHGLFSGPAIDRIEKSSFKKILVSNTLPTNEKIRNCKKIEIIDVSWLCSEAIRRQVEGKSLNELYDSNEFSNYN